MASNSSIDLLLKGARILMVEDEWLASMLFTELLTDFGCEIVGPASSVAEAVVLAAAAEIDAAVLDLNVKDELVYPVARTLADRGIPFVFLTGYAADRISETYRARPALQKPVSAEKLAQILKEMLNQSVK
jgi:CheY-like chemotaxis protein